MVIWCWVPVGSWKPVRQHQVWAPQSLLFLYFSLQMTAMACLLLHLLLPLRHPMARLPALACLREALLSPSRESAIQPRCSPRLEWHFKSTLKKQSCPSSQAIISSLTSSGGCNSSFFTYNILLSVFVGHQPICQVSCLIAPYKFSSIYKLECLWLE